MSEADPTPPQPEPLRIVNVATYDSGVEWAPRDETLLLTFNRPPTDAEAREIAALPPSPQIADDAMRFADRAMLAELALRLLRVLVFGGITLPESPPALDWIKDWIDGSHDGHGPIGHPMIWPTLLPGVCNLLREWGFQPTITVPPYVARTPQKNGHQAKPS